MAISNYDRVGKALELLKSGLQPYVEREMKAQHEQLWLQQARAAVADLACKFEIGTKFDFVGMHAVTCGPSSFEAPPIKSGGRASG